MRKLKFLRRLSPFYGAQTVSSATEQTGLIQTAPSNRYEARSYETMYPLHRQKPK